MVCHLGHFFAVPIVFAIAAFWFNAALSGQDLLLCLYHPACVQTVHRNQNYHSHFWGRLQGTLRKMSLWDQDRLFQDAVHDRVQALPGIYCGSRDAAVRYIYHGTTLANFIELKSEQPPMTPAEFFGLLSAVPGVLEVVLHPQSKLEQGKRGHYYQERAFLVYSRAHPQHGIEFELTTHNHVKNCSTISALYKSQRNRSQAMEAWRILKHSVAGRELNAGVVEKI